MHYIWVALIGLVVGALAKLIMPTRGPGGIVVTMLLGIAGSFIGTFVGLCTRLVPIGRGRFVISLIGAIIPSCCIGCYSRNLPLSGTQRSETSWSMFASLSLAN